MFLNTCSRQLGNVPGMCLYILIDGDKVSDEIMATQGLKQGCLLSPLLYSLFTNNMGKFLTTPNHGAMTALQTTKVSLCEYADDIALTK